MANSAGICNSFKAEVMLALHALGTTVVRGATTADTVKAALYLASATVTPATFTAYTATGEVSGAGYSAGGVTVTNATAPAVNGSQGVWTPSASIVFSGVTLSTSFDTVALYNSTQTNRAISIHTFTAQTITAGTLTLTMPANTASNALVQIQ